MSSSPRHHNTETESLPDPPSSSEEEEEDDGAGPDFSALAALGLGDSALAALREHLADAPPTAPTMPVGGRHADENPLAAADDSGAAGGFPVATTSNLDFKLQSYWNERFAVEDEYEWLADWSLIQPHLAALLPPPSAQPHILVVGCGNSRFSADLVASGYDDVTSTDFSEVCIEAMRVKHPELKWEVADMLRLDECRFGAGKAGEAGGSSPRKFDVVLDKAAMDALMCDEGSPWSPNANTRADADAMCRSVSAVLRDDGGLFVQISFAQPHFRKRYLTNDFGSLDGGGASGGDGSSGGGAAQVEGGGGGGGGGGGCPYGWDVSHIAFGAPGCLESYMYVCRKGRGDGSGSSEVTTSGQDKCA